MERFAAFQAGLPLAPIPPELRIIPNGDGVTNGRGRG